MISDTLTPGLVERALAIMPLGRLGAPIEIARSCAFLASDRAPYITGHALDVNGGQLIR
jgi:NAD(P)-dependent dehydrogenase (short-subunit alcohol dehydrogenase family)